jgi:serine/threonine protein kinase
MMQGYMRLVMHSTDGSSSAIDLNDVQLPLVIGRDADLAKVAIVDGQISRVHCRLLKVGEDWVVEDLTSRNGTFVNGARVAKSVIRPGDRLRVGSSQFTLEDETCGPDPLIGARISGFAIEEPLGRGRYGAVYKGTQVALHRPVAVKVLAPEFASDPERVQAFLTEARRAGALNHPNLVQVHDVVSSGSWYFLVMELMVGSVGDLLRDNGPLEEEAVRRILTDTCAALAFAEANRLVHRDVKPDNILFGEEGTYKLADLGIAAPISDDGVAHQERIFGSPHYVAPEQARGGTIDGRADLYALGATAFHLLTGRPMFEGTTREVVQSHLSRPSPDLRTLVPGLSPGMIQLIGKLVRKNPQERPRSAIEVGTMLERLAVGKPLVRPIIRRRFRRR